MDTPQITAALHHLVSLMDLHAVRIAQAEGGISYRTFLALSVLAQSDDTTQHQLARQLFVADAATSRTFKRLERQGLVSSRGNHEHARKQLVTITDQRREEFLVLADILEREFDEIIAQLDVDVVAYARDTQRLMAALQAYSNLI